uniref:Cytochrome P450 n=1 Tax=Macrostomum lignano TaxID=282301 RepID=A0A1I8HXQ1_9PLAT
MLLVATVILASCFLTAKLWKRLAKYVMDLFTMRNIIGPAQLPLVGNAHQFEYGGAAFYRQIMELGRQYQDHPMFRIWVGIYPIVVLQKAKSVESILSSSKHITKAFQYDFLHTWLGTGLLTSAGEKWHSRRKMLTPAFHFSILQDFCPVFSEQSRVLLQVHAQTEQNSEYVTSVANMSEIVMRRLKNPLYYSESLFARSRLSAEQNACLGVMHAFTTGVIAERRADFAAMRRRKRLTFLDLLLFESETGAKLTDSDIREEVDTFMFEGHDTTAAAMTWCLFLLGRHPDVQAEVHKEIDAIWEEGRLSPEGHLTSECLNQLSLLDRCVKEALRIYPSVPFFGREAAEDIEVDGYTITAGTTVLALATQLHRDPEYFPEPEKFNPDRFLPEAVRGRNPYAYVPFSAGPRNCIGAKFAQLEEKAVLCWFLRHYDVTSLQTEEEVDPAGELILRPAHGIRLRVQRRNV